MVLDLAISEAGGNELKISISGLRAEDCAANIEDVKITLYGFRTVAGKASPFAFPLTAWDAAKLLSFLQSVSVIRDNTRSRTGRFIELDEAAPSEIAAALANRPELLTDPVLLRAMIAMSPEACRAILANDIDSLDVESLAYRKRQLGVMQRLMTDKAFVAEYAQRHLSKGGLEAVWQHFFESNTWIFGFALNYAIGEGVSPDKLEQVVVGAALGQVGKRVDALLQSRGRIRSLCYVEIKTPATPLLAPAVYRSGIWHPSNELAGAVCQSQGTVQIASERFRAKYDNEETGEKYFDYQPRAIVVCGHLEQLLGDEGRPDVGRFRSFELFRRHLNTPEILTYDELLDRAQAVVDAKLAGTSALVQPTG